MEKQITLCGETLNVKFTFATVMEHEARYGKEMDTESTTGILRMIWVTLKVANKKWQKSLEEMAEQISMEEYSMLSDVVGEAMMEFYNIPKHAEDHVPEATQEDGEEAHP